MPDAAGERGGEREREAPCPALRGHGARPAPGRTRLPLVDRACARRRTRLSDLADEEPPRLPQSGWTTGFTNYRFAIPHFAGGEGRAVYNDVDQIYLADPGDLFDLDLGGHGFLAVAPDDTSVMLLDCQKMAGTWSLERAQRASKPELLREALARPGVYGPLSGDWNARDGEYRPGLSKLLHFTTLHTQPWRPFPAQLVYQQHEHAELWHALEREADAAGFEPFTRARPSARFTRLGSPTRLEDAPDEDVPWLLDERFRAGPVRETIRCQPSGRGRTRRGRPGRGGAAETQRTRGWWIDRFEAASHRHPKVSWEIELQEPDGGRWHRSGGPRGSAQPPSTWVLVDDRPGNSTQSIGLADGLGWPYQIKKLCLRPLARLHNRLLGASRAGVDRARSSPLEPPWPELVIAAGRRTAPVALWIREQSAGRTRLVQLGRNGADLAELFDLAVTPAYCRLFPHPNRIETGGDAALRQPHATRPGGGDLEAAAGGGALAADRAAGRRHLGSVSAESGDRAPAGAGRAALRARSRRIRLRDHQPPALAGGGRRALRGARGRRLGAPLEPRRRRQPLSGLPRARGRDRDHGRQRIDARRGDGARPTGLRVSASRTRHRSGCCAPCASRWSRARSPCRRVRAGRRDPSRGSSISARG